MTRRPGLLVGIVFAVGALLGLIASSVFLDVESGQIRSSAEAQLGSGPLVELLLDGLEDDMFDETAADVRAQQVRNLTVAAVVAVVGAIAIGHTVGRRAATEATGREQRLLKQ